MKLKKGFKVIILVILIVLLVAILAYGGYKVYKTLHTVSGAETVVLKEIPEYGYSLKDNATKYYKDLFDQLNDTLSIEEVNYEEYAKLVAQMLATDFYTINNKVSKTDVGGTQFILASYKENFILEAEESVYKYVEHNVYGDRKQSLPEVTSATVTDIKTSTYQYGDYTDENCFVATVELTYKEDLGYPTTLTIKMLHQDKKLEVFYMQ